MYHFEIALRVTGQFIQFETLDLLLFHLQAIGLTFAGIVAGHLEAFTGMHSDDLRTRCVLRQSQTPPCTVTIVDRADWIETKF
ncbi:hypothetical protein D3C84_1003020 [compost metagenome]